MNVNIVEKNVWIIMNVINMKTNAIVRRSTKMGWYDIMNTDKKIIREVSAAYWKKKEEERRYEK